MTETPAKKSDLGVRTVSAVVMLAVAGTALWLGGWAWIGLVGLVAAGVLWEWRGLVRGFAQGVVERQLWIVGGMLYIALATAMLMALRQFEGGLIATLQLVAMVVATDVGAYFAGRTIGGPKIAPSISPSKTWAGLIGGMFGASVVWIVPNLMDHGPHAEDMPLLWRIVFSIAVGSVVAIVAQTGDFFESWMKRRAGVKDSGSLIPGHGGLFDRVDGLLAVCFVSAIAMLITQVH